MANQVVFDAVVGPTGQLRRFDRAGFRRALPLFSNMRVQIVLRRPQTPRSIGQNRWYFGPCLEQVLDAILEERGYDHHERTKELKYIVHEELLRLRFGSMELPGVLHGAPSRVVPARRTSELTTSEFKEWMEWVVRLAATEYGRVITLPDERGWDDEYAADVHGRKGEA